MNDSTIKEGPGQEGLGGDGLDGDGLDREDRAALTAMARLMAGTAEMPVPRGASDSDESLVRENLEILGLMSYGLEPEVPDPAVKERLLASVGHAVDRDAVAHDAVGQNAVGQNTVGQNAVGQRPAAGEPQQGFDEITFAGAAEDPVDVTLQRPSDAPNPIPFPVERQAPPVPPPRRASRWMPLLAAALVLCIAGVGYLAGKVTEQSHTIANLSEQLQGIPVGDLSSLQAELETMHRRFNMVTTVARQAYHLQGVDPRAAKGPVDGVVYVCGSHQRWYLNVQGLEAPPAGEEYHLWFVTDDGMADGGVLAVGEGQVEMEAPSMPDGTHGFAVTLEAIGGGSDEPSGMMVLLGEESVSL